MGGSGVVVGRGGVVGWVVVGWVGKGWWWGGVVVLQGDGVG